MTRGPRPRRRVHYVRQLRALPVGTLLSFRGSGVAAALFADGWRLTGLAGTRTDLDLAANLPARVERRGRGPVRDLATAPRAARAPHAPLTAQTLADLEEVFQK